MTDPAWYEELRARYRPEHLRVLLIGESPPDPGAGERRFFYASTLSRYDNLYRGVAEALYGEEGHLDVTAKVQTLMPLRDDGFWPCSRGRRDQDVYAGGMGGLVRQVNGTGLTGMTLRNRASPMLTSAPSSTTCAEMPSHLQDMLEQWTRRTGKREPLVLAASLAGRVTLRFADSSNQTADLETGP
jgi:hypothetical protein